MSRNPLAQLFDHQILLELERTGRLTEFLRQYHKLLLSKIHPDTGGNNDLTALVNAAFDKLMEGSPSEIRGWIGDIDMLKNRPDTSSVRPTPTPTPERARTPTKDIHDLSGYIFLEATDLYSDTRITKDMVHPNHNWFETHKTLLKEGRYMPAIKPYMDLINLLMSGKKVYDGNKNLIRSDEVKYLLDDFTSAREPWKGVWLDTDFKVVKDKSHINYEHKLVGGVLVPQKSEPLDRCLMKHCYIALSRINRQGLPTRKSDSGIYYYPPLENNNSVARFGAGSDGAGLDCDRNPRGSFPGLGVRAALAI